MRKLYFILLIIFFAITAYSKTVEEYIKEANELEYEGKLKEAADLMEQASKEYPTNSDIHANWGMFVGQMAGQTNDVMEASILSAKSFELLDKAVALNPKNPNAWLFRGIMGVNVPKFMGKLKKAIDDFNHVEKLFQENPEDFPMGTLITNYRFLAIAYEKNEQFGKALGAWKKIDEIGFDTNSATEAQQRIAELEKQGYKEQPIFEKSPKKQGLGRTEHK